MSLAEASISVLTCRAMLLALHPQRPALNESRRTGASGYGPAMRITRLFVDHELAEGHTVGLAPSQSHYLHNVLRLASGDAVHLFNGRDGEWRGTIDALGRGWCSIALSERIRAQETEPDLWLVFAPIKRARIDFIAAKAAELGASALVPVFTENTAVGRVNTERLRANAIEAAEQCGRLTVPTVREPVSLGNLLGGWPAGRRLLVCDETGRGAPILDALQTLRGGEASRSWAILIGPEGGFSPSELDLLAETTIVTRVGLGPRILRADTAAIAALACWQAVLGDWRAS
jgi:16S rRNA (uracil1498-N3)-methyltransferase